VILQYIDIIFDILTVMFVVGTAILAVSSVLFVVRNAAARISIIRALDAEPGLLAAGMQPRAVQNFLKDSIAQQLQAESTAVVEMEKVLHALRYLLVQQGRKFCILTISRSDQRIRIKDPKLDETVARYAIVALRDLLDDHALFNEASDAVSTAIMKLNSKDVDKIRGLWARLTSINNLSMALGGRSRSAVNFFIHLILRGSIMGLTLHFLNVQEEHDGF